MKFLSDSEFGRNNIDNNLEFIYFRNILKELMYYISRRNSIKFLIIFLKLKYKVRKGRNKFETMIRIKRSRIKDKIFRIFIFLFNFASRELRIQSVLGSVVNNVVLRFYVCNL